MYGLSLLPTIYLSLLIYAMENTCLYIWALVAQLLQEICTELYRQEW